MSAKGQLIGYIRVSSLDQNTDRQLEQLEVDRVFTDKASGKDTDRPELQAMLEYVREGDMIVNPCKKKQLTNVRASGSDDAPVLTPPRDMNLEQALEWITDDEIVEITPSSVRIRKVVLDHSMRKRADKSTS